MNQQQGMNCDGSESPFELKDQLMQSEVESKKARESRTPVFL